MWVNFYDITKHDFVYFATYANQKYKKEYHTCFTQSYLVLWSYKKCLSIDKSSFQAIFQKFLTEIQLKILKGN